MFDSTRGRLLVAGPDLGDPNFRRAVVLVLDHDLEGALGLVLNRPTEVAVADALPDWEEHVSPPACMFLGGPVQPDTAIALGRGPVAEPLLADFGPVDLAGSPIGTADVRLFVGYSGWGPGQLENELARDDWFVVDALVADVTTRSPEKLWRDVLRRQRGRLAVFAAAPDDATLN